MVEARRVVARVDGRGLFVQEREFALDVGEHGEREVVQILVVLAPCEVDEVGVRAHTKHLRVAVLLDKPERRIAPVRADYLGFSIPNEFVVGYGLDYAERYRNLPYVGVLSLDSKVAKKAAEK